MTMIKERMEVHCRFSISFDDKIEYFFKYPLKLDFIFKIYLRIMELFEKVRSMISSWMCPDRKYRQFVVHENPLYHQKNYHLLHDSKPSQLIEIDAPEKKIHMMPP